MDYFMVIYQMGDRTAAGFFKHYENVQAFYNTCVSMGHVVEVYKRTDNRYEYWYGTESAT